jgi:hypothetical protein
MAAGSVMSPNTAIMNSKRPKTIAEMMPIKKQHRPMARIQRQRLPKGHIDSKTTQMTKIADRILITACGVEEDSTRLDIR